MWAPAGWHMNEWHFVDEIRAIGVYFAIFQELGRYCVLSKESYRVLLLLGLDPDETGLVAVIVSFSGRGKSSISLFAYYYTFAFWLAAYPTAVNFFISSLKYLPSSLPDDSTFTPPAKRCSSALCVSPVAQ
ncbi:hypothetical protein K402DRAFT_130004 [Aulographum hederae CBS 113979]|uniref:Uncharacterized protein n=1 Tax=Aulographum hederae CBS 113979 TaxID=1176131 RepID=A0A6G1HEG9_9PEZI|nr:hypothetical protein K402DRAFT_130004 [Aulographum hederae CBS 113979]